jgi:hypothetical protein
MMMHLLPQVLRRHERLGSYSKATNTENKPLYNHRPGNRDESWYLTEAQHSHCDVSPNV